MSLGINLLMYLTEIASKSLSDNFLSKVFKESLTSKLSKKGQNTIRNFKIKDEYLFYPNAN